MLLISKIYYVQDTILILLFTSHFLLNTTNTYSKRLQWGKRAFIINYKIIFCFNFTKLKKYIFFIWFAGVSQLEIFNRRFDTSVQIVQYITIIFYILIYINLYNILLFENSGGLFLKVNSFSLFSDTFSFKGPDKPKMLMDYI